MRILLTNDLPPGPGSGVEVHLSRIIEGLRAAGDEVAVLAGEVTHRGAAKLLDLWDPRARALVARRARMFGADVVHHHNVIRELSVAVVGATPSMPTVVTVHDRRVLGGQPENRGARALVDRYVKVPLDRRTLRRAADLVIALNPRMEEELRAAGFPRIAHVPQPAAPPHHPPQPVRDCVDVVFAGRSTHEKGPDLAVDAFLAVADRHPDARLVLIGDGPARTTLVGRTAGHPRIEIVGTLGPVELSARLATARVVIIPSRWPETGPLVALDAAAHGRPILASDVDGLRDLVGALGNGLTVPSGSVTAFAEGLDRLLADGDLAAQLGTTGQAAVRERHAIPVVTERLRDHYRALVADRG